jgi:transketolase N-terminal domain/subunit
MRIKSRPASVKVRGEKIELNSNGKPVRQKGGPDRKQNFLKITGGSKGYGKGISRGIQKGIQIDDQSMKTSNYR